MPGQTKPEFNLTSALISRRSSKLASFIGVSSDSAPGDYGKIRVLQLPQGVTINGPTQVANTVESNSAVSAALTPLRLAGSQTISGNLLTLPVANGLIYVQPFYVKSTGDLGYPTLQYVAAVYGDKVGFAKTLQDALNQVFGTGAGASATSDQGVGAPTPAPAPTPVGPSGSGLTAAQLQLVQQAASAYDDGTKALAKGDFAAYGDAQKRLKAALDQLNARSAAPAPTAKPGVTPTPAKTTPAPAKATPAPVPKPTPSR
jgi:uncharacterized membrane protein (UPF0182 family)